MLSKLPLETLELEILFSKTKYMKKFTSTVGQLTQLKKLSISGNSMAIDAISPFGEALLSLDHLRDLAVFE